MQLTALSLALTRVGLGGFAPSSLFLYGEQGAWYDPSDIERYTSQLGPELVTNGDFSNGDTGWTLGIGWTVVGGAAVKTGGVGDTLTTTISTALSKFYLVTFTVANRTAGSFNLRFGSAFSNTVNISANGVHTYRITPTSPGTTLQFSADSSFNGSLDNISVRELTAINTATMFQDSAGTTPVTAVEQPVGLILDKSKGLVLGPELVTNGDFSNGTNGWTANNAVISSANGQLTVNDSANLGSWSAAVQQISVVSGKTYRLTFDVISTSTGCAVALNTSATVNVSPPTQILNGGGILAGSKTFIFTATSATYLFIEVDGTGTAVFDNISVRELPGNHAFQTTTTSRPVLSARYNLLTKTEQFDDAVWSKSNATVTPNAVVAPDGTLTADKLVENTSNSLHFLQLASAQSYVAGITYVRTLRIKAAERFRGLATVDGGNTIFGSVVNANFNLQTGVIVASSGCVATLTPIEDGWYLLSMTMTAVTTGTSLNIGVRIYNDSGASTYTGDGVSGLYIWGEDLRPANQASLPYQRVNTSTDYDADPAKFPVYLRFDGVDDWLQTNSIDFTSTDKMTVFAGVRKLSDAALGMVAEHGIGGVNTNQWQLTAPRSAAANYGFVSSGTFASNATSSANFPAPTTNVLTGVGDISGDQVILRINGAQSASNTSDQGTGNYGNYPLYIGRRGGTTLPFNGQIYSLIVRGAQTSTTQIAQTERWVAGKTGVTL